MNQTLFTRSSLFPPAKHEQTAAEVARQRKKSAERRGAKRRKPRWKDRVAPAAKTSDEPEEDIIDEATLTRCARCPVHRNRQGRFRQLIDNGSYLCDDCYRTEFPATAMLDEDIVDKTELQRMGRGLTNVLRNKIVDTAADVIGITQINPDDGFYELNPISTEFPSEVECRMCLERGAFRTCCSGYYCHSCYYQSGRCPGCQVEAPLTGVAAAGLKPDPGKFAVGLSWALSFLLVTITAVGLALSYFNASTTPTTIWGHSCQGWFPVCDLAVCIDHDGAIDYGEGGGFLPAAQPYKVCDREASTNQVVASACVYDKEMYAWSNHLLGYDLCVSSPREENSRPRNVTDLHPLLLYSGNQSGVFIFDDDFEQPLRNVSAPWSEIVNGDRSSACGVNSRPPERGMHGGFEPPMNKKALVFTGVATRLAITAGMNIEHGGRVEFYLKMGPISTDDNSECKSAFSDVILEYITISASEWVTFGSFPAWMYRGEEFQFVSRDIPIDALSNSTRFRFRQASFDVLRDHWAIDDVRIFANLKADWEKSVKFEKRQAEQDARVTLAKCCYSSEQCDVFDKKNSNFDDEQCASIPGFDTSNSRLKLSELLILYMLLTAVAKALYGLAVRRFTRLASTLTGEHSDSCRTPEGKLFCRKSFRSDSQVSWQITVAIILSVALISTLYRLLDALGIFQCMSRKHADGYTCKTNGTFVVSCLLAVIFDTRAIAVLLSQVFCISPSRKQRGLEVVVDLNPDQCFMRVGSKAIPLSEVSQIQRQSRKYFWLLSILYMLAGLPLALGSLTIQSFELPSGMEAFSSLLGCMAILREIFGPSIFAKAYLGIKWLLAYKQEDRDELGRAVSRKGLLQQFMVGAIVFPVVAMFTLLGRSVEDVSAADNFIIFFVCVIFGGLFGLLLGIMHGLPVVPDAKFTGWPSVCCSVSYYNKVPCPCLFSCTSCGEVHSCQVLLLIALDDMYAFKRMLQGNLSKMPHSVQ